MNKLKMVEKSFSTCLRPSEAFEFLHAERLLSKRRKKLYSIKNRKGRDGKLQNERDQ